MALSLCTEPVEAETPPKESELKRVLILQSFGSDFAPFNVVSSTFRSKLAQAWPEPVQFYEVSVEANRSADQAADAPLVGYLNALLAERRLDLVVTIGGSAARFATDNRGRLFPDTPLLFAGVDQRLIPPSSLTSNDATSPMALDVPGSAENVLRVLPATENMVIILGSTPLERFWRGELKREFQRFSGRLHFIWWDELSFEEMLRRAADLPPRSAILFMLLVVDGQGNPHASRAVLGGLHEVANAPIFGIFDSQLGEGIVGGSLISPVGAAQQAVQVAVNILRGEPPTSQRWPPVLAGPPIYDWRELKRWGIRTGDLPPGSTVRFRPPSAWQQYHWPIVGGLSVLVLMAGLVAGLLAQRAYLRVAQREVRALSRRLLTALEDERRWLAGELHDDLAQRLARLAIDAARLERGNTVAAGDGDLGAMRREIVSMSADVHALSRRLHPSILDNLGLEEALRAEAERFTDVESITVELRLDELRNKPSPDASLCLYRIAQESLHNVARHARANRVEISLRTTNGGCELKVQDNGVGFDPARLRPGTSLGHASMRERVRLAGGRLAIHSVPRQGTTVAAWVPLPGGAS